MRELVDVAPYIWETRLQQHDSGMEGLDLSFEFRHFFGLTSVRLDKLLMLLLPNE